MHALQGHLRPEQSRAARQLASRMLMASVWLELYRLLPARLLSDRLPGHAALMVPALPASGCAARSFAACTASAGALVRMHNCVPLQCMPEAMCC